MFKCLKILHFDYMFFLPLESVTV